MRGLARQGSPSGLRSAGLRFMCPPSECWSAETRLHGGRHAQALGKDAPLRRAVQRSGVIIAIPILSGLHYHYVRI